MLALGVYGYSGAGIPELVEFWYRSLCYPNLQTMLYFSRAKHKGYEISEEAVRKHFRVDRQVMAKGGMQTRSLPGTGYGKTKQVERPLRRSERFDHRAGMLVTVDQLGPYKDKAYGGITKIHCFVDMAYAGGYMYLVFHTDAIVNSAATAIASMKNHWEQAGHHSDQWNQPVALLRSDSGAYVSASSGETCEGFKIKQQFSVPHSQAQNPAEARVKQLFMRVTMCFSQAPWVPRKFYTYAMAHCAQVMSLYVVGDETTPPAEQFHNKLHDFDANPILPFGCPLEVQVHASTRKFKFSERAFTGMYLFTPVGYKQGIVVYNPVTDRIRIARTYAVLADAAAVRWPRALQFRLLGQQPPVDDSMLPEMGGDPMAAPLTNAAPVEEGNGDAAGERGEHKTEGRASPVPVPPGAAAEVPEVQPIMTTPASSHSAATTAPLPPAQPSPAAASEEVPRQEVDQNLTPYDLEEGEEIEPRELELDMVAISSDELMAMTWDGETNNVMFLMVNDNYEWDADTQSVRWSSSKLDYVMVDEDELTDEQTSHHVRSTDGSTVNQRAVKARIEAFRVARQPPSYDQKRAAVKATVTAKRLAGAKRRTEDNPSLYTALRGPYKQMVQEAIDAELSQYIETYEALEVFPPERVEAMSRGEVKSALTSHIEITYKRNSETNELVKVKARLVIHGNQVDKYDFDAIKSPTAQTASIKMLMAILAKTTADGKTFSGYTWDVPGAFLQTKIADREEVKKAGEDEYVEPRPILLRLPDGRIGQLMSYVYGLKQASLEFRNATAELIQRDGYQVTADSCLFVKHAPGGHVMYVVCHVDDFFGVTTSPEMAADFDRLLASKYGDKLTRGSGKSLKYMGIVIEQMVDGSVFASQPAYVEKLWQKYAVQSDLCPENDAASPQCAMHAASEPAAGDDERIDSTWYRAVIGAINHLVLMTRPDLAYTVSVLAGHCAEPTRFELRRVRHLLRFIHVTQHLGINFKTDADFQLYAYADASYASRDNARSQSGYCFCLGANNAAFYARSSKQQLVTLSSTEAEYIALFHCATEIVFLSRLLNQMGLSQRPVVVYQDNQSTIAWARGQDNFQRTKHLNVKYHYVRDLVASRLIDVEYLSTDKMRADIQTKPLVNAHYQRLACDLLGLYSFGLRTESEEYPTHGAAKNAFLCVMEQTALVRSI